MRYRRRNVMSYKFGFVEQILNDYCRGRRPRRPFKIWYDLVVDSWIAPTNPVLVNCVGTGVLDRPLTKRNLRTVREAGPYEHRVRLCKIKELDKPEFTKHKPFWNQVIALKNTIKSIVEKQLNTKVKSVRECGKGASGSVYKVKITNAPFVLAIKSSKFHENLIKEKNMLDYLSSRVSYRVPKTYFLCKENDMSFLAMDFIRGISGKS